MIKIKVDSWSVDAREKELLQWMNDMHVAGCVSEVLNHDASVRYKVWTFLDDSAYTMFKLKWGDILEKEKVE